MLIRMLYVSRAVGPQTTAMTGSILTTAQSHNKSHGITGVLCQGQGFFLQVLEGERSAVNNLYARILADKRHKDVEILITEEITQRRYANWAMAHVNLSEVQSMSQINHPGFDPYSASGQLVMNQINNLIASGHPISQTPL